jgi:hypothetical protein
MILETWTECVEIARSQKFRSLREFAEDEIWLPPPGPYRGQRFRADRQPFTRILLDEISSDRWRTIVVTGPSQSSKTLSAFCIPILHTAIELQENVVVGIPEAKSESLRFAS